jgi:hypothetical protein
LGDFFGYYETSSRNPKNQRVLSFVTSAGKGLSKLTATLPSVFENHRFHLNFLLSSPLIPLWDESSMAVKATSIDYSFLDDLFSFFPIFCHWAPSRPYAQPETEAKM